MERQKNNLELIASENIVSEAVLEAQGSVMTNKYAEGYPSARWYGGCEYVDVAEDLAIKRAKELLKLHSTLNTKLILTVSSKGLGQLRAGDIIQVEIERENIERSQYMVLQIEHRMTGLLKLELGRYSKQLEDRFAELLISNKKTNSAIRNQKFSEPSTSFDFLDDLGIKPLRLHIRSRTSSGGATLGFGTTLNTSTAELGFEGGAAITLTTLVDEELV